MIRENVIELKIATDIFFLIKIISKKYFHLIFKIFYLRLKSQAMCWEGFLKIFLKCYKIYKVKLRLYHV